MLNEGKKKFVRKIEKKNPGKENATCDIYGIWLEGKEEKVGE